MAAAGYAVALVGTALTLALALLLQAAFALQRVPFILFIPAIFLAARSGLRPGLLATAAGALGIELLVNRTAGRATTGEEAVGLVLFVVIGAAISWLLDDVIRARARTQQMAADVERQARELAEARGDVERLSRDVSRRAQEFETLFEVAPIGIGLAEDPEARKISVNRHFAQLLRIDQAQNASLSAPADERPPFTVLTPDGQPIAADDLPLQLAARTGAPVRDVEVDVRYTDGTYTRLQEYAAPLFDEHGRVRGAIGAFIDITERRRAAAEQELLATASRLLASALSDTRVLAQLPQLAVPSQADWAVLDLLDDDGHPVRVGAVHRDPALTERLRHYAVEHPLDARPKGRPGPLDLVAGGRPLLLQDVRAGAYVGEAESEDHVAKMAVLGTASGVVVPVLAQRRVVAAMAWARGADRPRFDARDLALAEEVARRVGIAIERVRLYREAQEANRLKDEFLATLSHEMRTPLNALLGWVQLLRSGQLPPDKAARALEAIERSASLQAQLTADLLDVSRAITGKLRLERREVQVQKVIEDAVDALRPAAESKGLQLLLDVPAALPPLVADPGRLHQVLHNLIGNAIKFTADGSVRVQARDEGGAIAVTVTDTGIGIRPEFLPFVFDRFRQGDQSPTREHGGLGLGLSIVRHLTELHGGTVSVASDGTGKGASFTVRMPVRPPAA